MTMSDLFIPECNATPHPAAVASGTCPAPSPEPTTAPPSTPATDTPSSSGPGTAPAPQPSLSTPPTEPALTASAGVADSGPGQPHLPQTGLDMGWALLGVLVIVLGVAALMWGSLRER